MKKLFLLLTIATFCFTSCSKDKIADVIIDPNSNVTCQLQLKITQPETITFSKCYEAAATYSASEGGMTLLLYAGESDVEFSMAFGYEGGTPIQLNKPYNIVSIEEHDHLSNPQDYHVLYPLGIPGNDERRFGFNTIRGTITYTDMGNTTVKGVFNFEAVETDTQTGEDIPGSALKVVDGKFTTMLLRL